MILLLFSFLMNFILHNLGKILYCYCHCKVNGVSPQFYDVLELELALKDTEHSNNSAIHDTQFLLPFHQLPFKVYLKSPTVILFSCHVCLHLPVAVYH